MKTTPASWTSSKGIRHDPRVQPQSQRSPASATDHRISHSDPCRQWSVLWHLWSASDDSTRLFASQFVSGYEGPAVPQTVKVVGFVAMAPLPLLVILEAWRNWTDHGQRKAVARLRWWAILRAFLAALGLILGVLTKEANINYQLEMNEAMQAAFGPDVPLPNDPNQVEQNYNFGLLVGLLLGLAAPTGVGLWLMGGRGARLQERLDLWRVATGGRP